MLKIEYNGQQYDYEKDESILNCLLRQGIEYPHSCKAGICQACLIKTPQKEAIETSWQAEIPNTLKAQGYFLACMAKPKKALQLTSADSAECDSFAVIQNIELLNYNVMQIKLSTDNLHLWVPGQYINLINSENTSRSYSIANIPCEDGYIELHIKRVLNGDMCNWLWNENRSNTVVRIRGPFGKCYYFNPNNNQFDILLAGTGTGLAPLIAIMRSAANQNHQGKIALLHGGLKDDDIYYTKEIAKINNLKEAHYYEPCVLKSNGQYSESSIDKKLKQYLTNVDNMHVYLCGPAEIVKKLKKEAFLAGVPSSKIFSDAFV